MDDPEWIGGADRTRTDDPLHAMQALYQLSYSPGGSLQGISRLLSGSGWLAYRAHARNLGLGWDSSLAQ